MEISDDLSRLRPFHGYQTSIIPLSSSYYLYLASWDQTPTQFSRFSNVWLVTPAEKRILFCDPEGSCEIVTIFHEFDEIYAASIAVEWIPESQLHFHCRSTDGAHDLDVKFNVRETLRARLLLAIGSGPPSPFRLSPAVIAVSEWLVNALVARTGSVLLGRTETGQPFYHGDSEHLYQVTGSSVTLNGEDLGTIASPVKPVEFGDAVPYGNPVVKLGTLYIPFAQANTIE